MTEHEYGWVTNEEGRSVYRRLERPRTKRSHLATPQIISDIMPPTEQVDGKFYTSKSAFRRVGKSLGLIEVGNEKPKPRVRRKPDRDSIKASVERAIAKSRNMGV